jgi:hypothetical protein
MDAKRIVIGTIVGGVALFILGYLIFEVIAVRFYTANMTAVEGVFLDAPLPWAIGVGNLSMGALLTLGILNRGGTPTLGAGAVTGAVIGLLVWICADFTYYALANVWTLTAVIVDPLIEAIHNGIAAAIIAIVLARVPKSAR